LATIEIKEFSLLAPRLTVDVEDAETVSRKLIGVSVTEVTILERITGDPAELCASNAARPTMGPNNLFRRLIEDPIDSSGFGIIVVQIND
jgi:hypothetical protein